MPLPTHGIMCSLGQRPAQGIFLCYCENPKSFLQNVCRSVSVPVVVFMTVWAVPLTNRQILDGLVLESAVTANSLDTAYIHLPKGRGFPPYSVNPHYLLSPCLAKYLVFQHSYALVQYNYLCTFPKEDKN